MLKLLIKLKNIQLNNLSIKKNLEKIYNKGFTRNVIIVMSGTASAHAITLLFSPVITRIYGPEAFGILGLFTSLITIISPIASLTYPTAIVLPREDNEAKILARLSLYIALILSLFTGIILLIFGEDILNYIGMKELLPFIIFIPISMFFGATLQITQQWLYRKQQFNVTAKVSVIQALLVNITKVGFGIINPVATSLIVITSFGTILHTFLLRLGTKTSMIKDKLVRNTRGLYSSPRKLIVIAKKYYDFPLYRAPEVFLNSISQGLPIIILSYMFGPISAGYYSISKRVVELPTQLIGRSAGDVLYPRLSKAAHENQSISSLLIKSTLGLAAIGIVPFGIVIIYGPNLFSFVFGNEWYTAGEYATWISIWAYFVFINIPSIKTLPVISAQQFLLIFSTISSVLRFLTLFIGGYIYNNEILAIGLYSVLGAVLNILLIVITYIKSRNFKITRY